MKVDDLHVAYLRAQIAGEQATMLQVLGQLTGANALEPLVPLVHGSFVIAVRKWFGHSFTHAQVIKLVAHARALFSEQPELIDPLIAESEIRRALGENVPPSPDPNARGTVQLAVLDYLVRALDLNDQAIEDFLKEAGSAANDALGRVT